uniref:G_PROTEIN_RECEP_F1_2 domain-containing protein n=2 Tax=Caenorhabditis tropicalis TaxID=1561998 RepID=A0A1I7TD18_9PELO
MAPRRRLKNQGNKPSFLRKSMNSLSISNSRPAACFEIFNAQKAGLLTVFMQILTMLLEVGVYFIMESKGYFVSNEIFRMIILPVATVYIGGAIIATFGILTKKRLLITIHTTITMTLMLLTDILAVSIILLMAIGKRSTYLNELPGHFVNERKFYSVLGPFWMYLGAISLHITVAVNMAFLQPLNEFSSSVQVSG